MRVVHDWLTLFIVLMIVIALIGGALGKKPWL